MFTKRTLRNFCLNGLRIVMSENQIEMDVHGDPLDFHH